jgi:hypothetical protein
MSTPYGPATGLVNFVRSVPKKIDDGVNWAEQMLGGHPSPPPQQADPGMVNDANESFRHTQPPPVASKPRMRLPQK